MAVTVFGGGAVQTAYVSFTHLDISTYSITLVWPTSYFNVPNEVDGIHYDVLAASFTVNNAALGNDYTITLPNAMESSVGSNFIIKNIGVRSFKLLKSDGVTQLIVIPNTPDTANSFWVQLIDNSTSTGEWQFVQFGAGISQAQASLLVGNGLVSLGGLLNTNINVEDINITPHNISLADRAKLFIWKTGTGQINLPLISSPVPNGFYISVNNEGSGILTISGLGGAQIDNQPSITVTQGQSLSIISDGIKWWSLGFGKNIAASDFISGSPLTPSITFIADPSTGIYYQTLPIAIGFSVGGALIANISGPGLSMNLGKNIFLRDVTNNSDTILSSNASYGQLSWNENTLVNFPTLRVSGTEMESRLTLGPFSDLVFSLSSTEAHITYNSNDILNIDNLGVSTFTFNVNFESSTTFNATSTFNDLVTFNATSTFTAPVTFGATSIFNATSTFNAPVVINNTFTLSTPLPIVSGGTGQNNQQNALNALMPAGPATGDLLFFDGANWILLPIGADNSFLKVTGGIPTWVP